MDPLQFVVLDKYIYARQSIDKKIFLSDLNLTENKNVKTWTK